MIAEPFVLSSISAARGYRAIGDYSLIGDCRTAALVANDASIDWCCLPNFDSEAVLSRLIGAPRGGYLAITHPETGESPLPVEQRYLPNTAILQTEIAVGTARLLVTDYMPTEHLRGQHWPNADPCLVRRIEALTSDARFAVRFKVAPDYGREAAQMTMSDEGVIVTGGHGVVVLGFADNVRCEGAIEHELRGPFMDVCELRAGESATFVLGWAPNPFQASKLRRALRRDWSIEEAATRNFWQNWAAGTEYAGPYRAAVIRSAITLKLLTFQPTGAMVAAPTTSLPELVGGTRNWDYRYTWIRDASFAAGALAELGHTEEAVGFIQWVEHRERRSDREMRVLYGIRGDRSVPEVVVAPMEGYRKSSPVRVGNGAVEQKQIDINGEWLDCVARVYLRPDAPRPDRWLSRLIDANVTFCCDHWMEPDAGIWEVRSAQQNFVYSKMMCWVAADRGVALAEKYRWDVDVERWRRVREMIYDDVLTHGIDPETGAFAISYEATGLDAATLMAPIVGFVPPADPHARATADAIARDLTDERGFVYRYRHFDDGVGGEEGTFVMCSFWLAENLALQGRRAEATALFERLLACASPTGLISEMVDSGTGELLGNYPQAFSHLGLIRAALALSRSQPPR